MNYKTPKVIPAFVLGMVLAPVLHATTIVVDNRTPQAVPAGS